MRIRKADKTDKEALLHLDAELDAHRKANFSPETKAFHERTNPHSPFSDEDFETSSVFVALDDRDQFIGFIRGTVSRRENHVLSRLGYIDELYVKAEARGQGVAKGLLSALETEFRKQGCDHMTTHTDAENHLSQAFYPKAGMIPATVEFWKEL